eukprot:768533-Hanusia_phi.AAC.6
MFDPVDCNEVARSEKLAITGCAQLLTYLDIHVDMEHGPVVDKNLHACIADRLSWRAGPPPDPLPDRWTARPPLQPGAVNRVGARERGHAGALGLLVSWDQPFTVHSAANVLDEQGRAGM